MPDPRFNGDHLESPRHELYERARECVFDSCGEQTMTFELAAPPEPPPLAVWPTLPPDVPYALLDTAGGHYHPLRIGLTAVGRAGENDIILGGKPISRRHCVLIVHATGGCEVHDTASRNGTRVNGRAITRVWLLPGDVLQLCDCRFVLTGRVSREEAVFRAHAIEAESQTTGARGGEGTSAWCVG
jgi:hypothetical protein